MFETKEGQEKGMTEARTWRSPGVQESRGCGTEAAWWLNDYHIWTCFLSQRCHSGTSKPKPVYVVSCVGLDYLLDKLYYAGDIITPLQQPLLWTITPPPILSKFFPNFSCLWRPPRLVRSSSPSGYILPRCPPVTYWLVFFCCFFFKVTFEKHPNGHFMGTTLALLGTTGRPLLFTGKQYGQHFGVTWNSLAKYLRHMSDILSFK